MVLQASRRMGQALPWLRLLALLPISLLLGHDAVFATQFGLGDEFRRAMTGGGHDGYWSAFSFVILVLASGLLTRAGVRAMGLRRRLAHVSSRPAPDAAGGGYFPELRSIWPSLFVATAVGFAIMENLEHLLAGQTPHGIGSLIGADHPLAIPILALVTANVAALGALVRWRIRALEERGERAAGSTRFARPPRLAPAPEWLAAGDHRVPASFQVRLDACRAPPLPA